jgi:hypothetical protein
MSRQKALKLQNVLDKLFKKRYTETLLALIQLAPVTPIAFNR